MTFTKRRAFTLTEMALVMGVVGIVLGVVWQQFQVLRTNKMTSQEMQQLTTIAQNIRSVYGSGNDLGYTAWTDVTLAMVSANVFPSDMPLTPAGIPTTAEGGTVKIEFPSNAPNPTTGEFEVEFFTTPQTCARLLQLVAGAFASLNVIYVYDNVHGWQNPAAGPLSFTGCTYASFDFRLH